MHIQQAAQQREAHKYVYKVKIFNSKKRSKFVVRQVHHFESKLSSLDQLQDVLSEELGEDVPESDTKYNMGYFDGRRQTKRWLVCEEDLETMYTKCSPGSEIFLWCDGRIPSDEDSQGTSSKEKPQTDGSVSKRQAREEELDSIFLELKEKHGDDYSVPQLRLWARMITSGTHDNLDDPPRVPMILGAPLPKRQKQESITTALVGAATAFAKAISPPPTVSSTSLSSGDSPARAPLTTRNASPSVGISPGKTVDLCMKNLEQLRYIQRLMEDGILSNQEFLEQKSIIMGALSSLRS